MTSKAKAAHAARLAALSSVVDELPQNIAQPDLSVIEVDPKATRMNAAHRRSPIGMSGESIADLVGAIASAGQQIPCKGYYLDKPVGGITIELIYGARRRAAALELGRPLRVSVVPRPTDLDLVKAMLSENGARSDYSPLEFAREWEACRAMTQLNNQQLAAAVGAHPSTVSRTLGLLSLPEPVLGYFEGRPKDLHLRDGATLVRLCKDSDAARERVTRAVQSLGATAEDPLAQLLAAADPAEVVPATPTPPPASAKGSSSDRPEVTKLYFEKTRIGTMADGRWGREELVVKLGARAPEALRVAIRALLVQYQLK